MLLGQLFYLIIVNPLRFPIHSIMDKLIPFAGEAYRAPMAEVSPMSQAHAHHLIPVIQQGKIDGCIGLSPAMRLDIGILSLIELLCPKDGHLLHFVNFLTTTIVAVPWVTLSVLVGQDGALCLQHRAAGVVLGRNEHQFVSLSFLFVSNCRRDFWLFS